MSAFGEQSVGKRKRAREKGLVIKAERMLHADAQMTLPDWAKALGCTLAEARAVMHDLIEESKVRKVPGPAVRGYVEQVYVKAPAPNPLNARRSEPDVHLYRWNSHLCHRCGQRAFGKNQKWRQKHRKKDCNANVVKSVLDC